MRLNLQSDYALRLLMYLAINDARLSTISEVAAHYGISRNHLMKIAHRLGQNGYIETVKGRSGGLRLAKAADRIVIADVVRAMEGDFAIVECFQGKANRCLITPACRLKGVLGEAVAAFLAVLDRYTMADLTENNAGLTDLLMSGRSPRLDAR